ncbi:hypothetical protein FC18_GL001691 [Lacticaseibacillus sharpeae JCM 1186 = DSM 20505]|uniref:Cell wall surface anchor family protein n=2 Tax=Lacticaseibacillus sharpeae TaxID=1626 RepID=A0A0R1ZJ60_9LACO|nr:hypothetical protein FC18_GL001691 [Lacticaseibacillus sharpeae JCM 1186 = DSM 20505]
MVLTVLLGTFASLIGATTVKADDATTVTFNIHKRATREGKQVENNGIDQPDIDDQGPVKGAGFDIYNVTQLFYSKYDGTNAKAIENTLQSNPNEVISSSKAVDTQTTNDDGDAIFSNLPTKTTITNDGHQVERDSVYAFVESTTPENFATSAMMIVALPVKNADRTQTLSEINLYPKDSMLTKQIQNPKEDGQYQIGDTLTYEVTLPIPADITSTNHDGTAQYQQLLVGDSMSDVGATFGAITKMTVDGEDAMALKDAGQFTNKQDGADLSTTPESWTLDFSDLASSKYAALAPYAGKTLIIDYTVTLNQYAQGGHNLDNELTFNFGHTPNEHTLKTVVPLVPFGGHRFSKVDSSNTDEKLGGAEFYLVNANGEYASFKFANDAQPTDGNYNPESITWVASRDGATKFTTSSEKETLGNLTINDLKYGNYKLIETKAPDGYALPASATTNFTVDKTEIEKTELISIKNTKEPGTILPMTGGMGFILFALVGLALFGAGFIVMKRGKEA